MPVFTLTDIQFKTPSKRSGVSQLTEDANKLKILRYPIDLGSADKGHYMVININEQINTQFGVPSQQMPGVDPTVIANRNALSKSFGNFTVNQNISGVLDAGEKYLEKFSKTELGQIFTSLFASSASEIASVSLNDFKQNNEKFGLRTIRRITDAIAFYMPDTLNFQYAQNYDNLNPGSQLSGQVLAAGSTIAAPAVRGENIGDILKTLSPFAAKALASIIPGSDISRILFTAGTGGLVSNPMIDIIYSSPSFRNFRFDFLMYPRDSLEAREVNNIIDTLRFHQAPELVRGTGGAFLYPPSEFDISFYYNGVVNPNIPRISTCVLRNIDVDYVPTGNFSAYEIPGRPAEIGGTGTPVAVRLSLEFVETEYLVKGNPVLSERGLTKPSNAYIGDFFTNTNNLG